MTEPVSKRSIRFSMLRVLVVLAVVLGPFAFLLFGPVFLGTRRFLVIQELLFGWWSFIERNAPQITLNWDLLGMAAVCVLGVLVLSHALLRRFAHWRLRSAIALNGVIWLSFFTATAVAGVVEHARWLHSTENEPLLVVRKWGTRSTNVVNYLGFTFKMQIREKGSLELALQNVRHIHQDEFATPMGRYRDFRVFYLTDATNGYAGLIAFRRPEIVHPDKLVGVSSPENGTSEHPRDELPRLLSRPGLTAVPLF